MIGVPLQRVCAFVPAAELRVRVGKPFTITEDVLPLATQPYPSVTVNAYIPAFAAIAFGITGF